ncbi:alpha/beta hydrolase [Actibacterium pelagium]|uniref:Alpha/beta hydrolase n=1 Tax=Actibacterium pelagium TaxID=2029103 RepID=A0A917AH37_9RHOB|nr:alpha/beta hydrolase [Actibacterium pelagium]GGE50563.1 alpha/beta hydrolase [Actibacterium pelagium]
MSEPSYLETPSGRRIAYHKTEGAGPGVVFLGGFRSDMEGTKAVFLEDWARQQGRAFLRFDYSGHGQSSEEFTDGSIGDWAEDAQAAVSALTEGPQVFVGSSMGGWISLLVGRERPDLFAGFVGIAAAPDFTEDGFWADFSEEQRAQLIEAGQVALPSGYDEGDYIITRRLIEEGRNSLVLRTPLSLPCSVRLLQGTEDEAVTTETALRLLDHLQADDSRLTLVKGADHRFSDPQCLDLIADAVLDVGNS